MADVNALHVIGSIAVTFIGIGVGDVIRRLYRMEKKQDEQTQMEAACRLDLKENYARWSDLTGPDGRITKIEDDRHERWKKQDELNLHRERDLTQIKTKLEIK